MIEVAPQDAKLGDFIFNGSTKGVVCGISNDDAHAGGGTVSVIWTHVPGCDVIGIKSPVWMHYDIVRHVTEQLKCEKCGGVILADESGCPSCVTERNQPRDAGKEAAERDPGEPPHPVFDNNEPTSEQLAAMAEPAPVKLPWNE